MTTPDLRGRFPLGSLSASLANINLTSQNGSRVTSAHNVSFGGEESVVMSIENMAFHNHNGSMTLENGSHEHSY